MARIDHLHETRPLGALLGMLADDDIDRELEALEAIHCLLTELRHIVAQSSDKVACLNELCDMAHAVGNRHLDAQAIRDEEIREEQREAKAMEFPEIYYAAPKRI